jgi:L-ascorbate metabolism protein UlaG (beta-lactamase superfamily)
MNKAISSLALVVLAGWAAAADEAAPRITIRWHGQSFFEIISSKGTRIVIDPHAIEAYGRKVVQADIVLISHLHDDHTQISVVENAKKAKIIYGLKDEKGEGRRQEYNVVDVKIKDVRIRNFGTYHDAMGGMQRGKNAVFVIEMDGLRIAHLGDLGHTLSEAQRRRLGEVDILMIPVGGVYTLNGLDAYKVVEQIKPKRFIFPMHYGTINYDYLLKPDAFLAEFKETGNVRTVANSNEYKIDPKGPVPEMPLVMMLQWFSKPEKGK